MSVLLPARGRLTDDLLAHLRGALEPAIAVGDHETPPQAGWTGQAQHSNFAASVVVRTGLAVANHRDSLSGRHSSWRMSYGFKVVGAVRAQCDDTADIVRTAVQSFELPTLGQMAQTWQVTSLLYTQLGDINRVGNDENATFELNDSMELWLDRKRG